MPIVLLILIFILIILVLVYYYKVNNLFNSSEINKDPSLTGDTGPIGSSAECENKIFFNTATVENSNINKISFNDGNSYYNHEKSSSASSLNLDKFILIDNFNKSNFSGSTLQLKNLSDSNILLCTACFDNNGNIHSTDYNCSSSQTCPDGYTSTITNFFSKQDYAVLKSHTNFRIIIMPNKMFSLTY